MKQLVLRVVGTSAVAALASGAFLLVAYADRAALTLEMDRELPRRIASGIYPPERVADLTFAWTADRAELRLRGLNREKSWVCAVDFRGDRPAGVPQPTVELAADGLTLGRQTATNEFQRLQASVPPRPSQPGLLLALTASETMVPGPADRRELGVQIDRVMCRPEAGASVTPPGPAFRAALLAAIAIGAALAVSLPLRGALLGAVLVSAGQALPLASGVAPYSSFPDTALSIALRIAFVMAVAAKLLERRIRHHLSHAASFVVVFSAAVLYLKLLGLLHPSKPIIDALFHAHRFQMVFAGNYYFTQVMPSGVTFPYAVGLYVVALPWAALTRDHILLLRVVVAAMEVVAGALLYVAIVKTWGDRLGGAAAVVLFHTVPLPYILVGNANLTNVFGQAVALVALALAAIWSSRIRSVIPLAALLVVTSLAFLSHISTAAQLAVTLLSLAALSRLLGDSAARASAIPLLVVTLIAAALAWGIYYGHFTEVYATALERVRPSVQTATSPEPRPESRASEMQPAQSQPSDGPTLFGRTRAALRLTIDSLGWPLVILASAGVWSLWKGGARDPLALLVVAWAATYLAFLCVGVIPRVEAPFQRYAAEFVGRVVFGTYPAAVILAARGAIWGLRAGTAARVATVASILWAIMIGLQQWRAWYE